jgi:RimJ/RimL family protein N-acetyltransferase
MREIETVRLKLRRFTLDDLKEFSAIRGDPDVMTYIGAGKPESVEQAQTVLDRFLAHWDQHGFGRWAAIDRETNKLIGWCGLSYLENTEDVEIGYGFAKSHWGKGLASEAAAEVLKWGFEDLRLDQIVAVAWPENAVSRQVMERLGMTFVKMARHNHKEVVFYALSREEYLAASRGNDRVRFSSGQGC